MPPRWSVYYHQPEGSPVLPLPPGPVTNGEFLPAPPTRRDRALHDAILADCETAARRAGIDRRRFLQGAGAVVATLGILNLAGCSGGGGRRSGGRYRLPAPPTDVAACEHGLATPGQFIFDTHTHHVIPADPWVHNAPETVQLVLGMLPADCRAPDPLECVNRANYLHDVFFASDTTMALLSDVPNSGPHDAPIPFSEAIQTQAQLASLGAPGAPRLLLHNVIAPNFGPLGARLDDMSAQVTTRHVAGFKVYTAWGPDGQGYSLADPSIGLPVIQHAHDLGIRVITAHKGLPLLRFDAAHNGPDDIVALSRLFPDMNFVVFHAAWDPNHREGPYDPTATRGIDTLLRALDVHGVPPDTNVWVDLGTLLRQLLTDPDQAGHALGKLLTRVGQRRVLWGTDAIWYGSPQPQLQAFRAFQITPEYQQRFGYPELTDDLKADILGRNAAQLYQLDTHATRCALNSDPLSDARAQAAQLQADHALPSPWQPRGPTTRRELFRWLRSPRTPWTPL